MREGLEDLLFFVFQEKRDIIVSAIGGRCMKDLHFYLELEDKEWERIGEKRFDIVLERLLWMSRIDFILFKLLGMIYSDWELISKLQVEV